MQRRRPRNLISVQLIPEARQGKAGDSALSTSATLGHLVGSCAFRGGPEQLWRMLHGTDQELSRCVDGLTRLPPMHTRV